MKPHDCDICNGRGEAKFRVTYREFNYRKGWARKTDFLCPSCLRAMRGNDENFREIRVKKG